jgi:hypothetical protein
MIYRDLLPSYGEERSTCSLNILVPVYSTTQHHIQQDRIIHDIYYLLGLQESYSFKINKVKARKQAAATQARKGQPKIY